MELDYVKLKLIKPALAGYIRESQIVLKLTPVPDEQTVHDVRVLMKKARAALRLAGPQLDKDYFEREMVAFREVGRVMCSWRDSSVQRRILKDLRKEYPRLFSKLVENEIIAKLVKKPELNLQPAPEILSGMVQIEVILRKAGFRIRFENMNNIDPGILIKELGQTYSKVVNIYLSCRYNSKPASMHKFRKKSKDFLYQLYFFRPLNLPVVKNLEKKLDLMTQNLGRFNDISQLIKALGYKYPESVNTPAMNELIVILRDKQDSYLAKVWPVAHKIFCPGQNLVNVLGFKLLVI